MKEVNIRNNVEIKGGIDISIPTKVSSIEEQLMFNLVLQISSGFVTRCNAKRDADNSIELTLQYENNIGLKLNSKIFLKDSDIFDEYFKII